MKTLVCPYTKECLFYEGFCESYGARLNILFKHENSYSCLALSAHDDICGEGGIVISKKIRESIKDENVQNNINMGNVGCSHLEILNNQSKLMELLENGN